VTEAGPEALSGARGRLLAATARETSPRRAPRPWTVRLAGIAAAGLAVAAAVAIVTNQTAVPATEPRSLTSAKDVLLVAADSARRAPQEPATYWHIRREDEDGAVIGETWTTRDGRRWSRGEPGNGRDLIKLDSGTFLLGTAGDDGPRLTMEDLETLPAEPEALRRKVVEMRKGDAEDGADPALIPLLSLVAELPAPAGVRAAAFRALAELPGVRRLRTVEDGEELQFRNGLSDRKVVIDPDTSRVVRTDLLPAATGGITTSGDGFIKLTAEWTDEGPR